MKRSLLSDPSGSSAVEFAIVLPLLLVFLLGIIDVGRWVWTYNRAEKAAQMGARFAVVTNYVSSDIGNSYLNQCSPALTQGDAIPASCFTTITCRDSGCSSGTLDQTAFRKVVDRMRLFMPELQYSNVLLVYSASGLGYAGDPYGHDVSPLVTIKIGASPAAAVQFTPITSFLLARMTMPPATTTLTAEDLDGSQSN